MQACSEIIFTEEHTIHKHMEHYEHTALARRCVSLHVPTVASCASRAGTGTDQCALQ